jgi:hypothetical protein
MGLKTQEVFAPELAKITDPDLRDFVVAVADRFCQESFWTRPTSTSLKYHPKAMNLPGGLIQHTKYGVWWALELCRCMDDPTGGKAQPPHQDVVIAAVILHDMMKDGDPVMGRKNSTAWHGIDLGMAIRRDMFGGGTSKMSAKQKLVVVGITCHMGVWTGEEKLRPQNITDAESQFVAHLVHLADYCASRKVDTYFEQLASNN